MPAEGLTGFAARVAAMDRVSRCEVAFYSGWQVARDLSDAQAGGYACLVCGGICGAGEDGFVPVGAVLGGSQVFVHARHAAAGRYALAPMVPGVFLGACEWCSSWLWADDEGHPVDGGGSWHCRDLADAHIAPWE